MQPPPIPKQQFAIPSGPFPEPTRAEMRRSLLIELSNEIESVERDMAAQRSAISTEFNAVWSEFFGVDAFPSIKKAFIFRMGL